MQSLTQSYCGRSKVRDEAQTNGANSVCVSCHIEVFSGVHHNGIYFVEGGGECFLNIVNAFCPFPCQNLDLCSWPLAVLL